MSKSRKNTNKSTNNIATYKEQILKNAFQTPKKLRKSLEISSRRQAEKIVTESLNNREAIRKLSTIDYNFCEKSNIKYLCEVVALIISSKEIKNISIFTPFGECNLNLLSTDNYMAKINNVSMGATTYKFLLNAINKFQNKEKLIKKIKEYIMCKINYNFKIDLGKNINEEINKIMSNCIETMKIEGIDNQVEYSKNYSGIQYKITYKNVATLFCGILICEMVRSAGKLVRSAFLHSEWPESIEELRRKFLQSNSQGCRRFRNVLMRNSLHKNDEEILRKGLENVSPQKKKRKIKLT